MISKAKTVEEYIASLPEERQEMIKKVREIILKNLPEGYEENMNWGMITYEVPLETYPDTYNGQPIAYAAIASQKNYCSIYLMGIYIREDWVEELIEKYKATGKKLDMGKSCLRFKKLEDIPLDLIGESIAKVPVEEYLKWHDEHRQSRKSK